MSGLLTKASLGVVGIGLALSLWGCAGQKGISPLAAAEKVMTIDGAVITRAQYEPILKQYQKMMHYEDTPENRKNVLIQETLKRMALNQLILDTLLRQDAEKMGVTVKDEEFKSIRDQQIAQFGGDEAFQGFLKANGLTEKEFETTLRQQILLNKFLEKKGGQSIAVTPEEVKSFYEKNKSSFDVPESIRASHILIKMIEPELKRELRAKNPKITDAELAAEINKVRQEKRATAQNVLAQVQAQPAKFGELAKKYSDDTVSAANGGDLNYLQKDAVVPGFWEGLKATKPGTVNPKLVETQFGYHVVLVRDHAAPHKLTLKEATDTIQARLSGEKKQKLLESWATDKKNKAKIDVEAAYKPMEPEELQKRAKAMEPPASAPAPAGKS